MPRKPLTTADARQLMSTVAYVTQWSKLSQTSKEFFAFMSESRGYRPGFNRNGRKSDPKAPGQGFFEHCARTYKANRPDAIKLTIAPTSSVLSPGGRALTRAALSQMGEQEHA
jgi:hypothetical protein